MAGCCQVVSVIGSGRVEEIELALFLCHFYSGVQRKLQARSLGTGLEVAHRAKGSSVWVGQAHWRLPHSGVGGRVGEEC